MNSLNQKCRLCNGYLINSPDQLSFTCYDCNIEFGIYNNHWFSQSYMIRDSEILGLIMHLDTEFTSIIFTKESGKKRVVVNKIWPHTPAKDALNLAKKLLSLKVFY